MATADSWVTRIMQWDVGMLPAWPQNYDTTLLNGSLLGPYCCRSTGIYKCPGEEVPGRKGPRVRSISMNGQMGGISTQPDLLNQYGGGKNFKVFYEQVAISSPNPSMAWVFIDEHADSINGGFFRVQMEPTTTWKDVPASYHGASSNVPAAPPYTGLRWLQARTTSLP